MVLANTSIPGEISIDTCSFGSCLKISQSPSCITGTFQTAASVLGLTVSVIVCWPFKG